MINNKEVSERHGRSESFKYNNNTAELEKSSESESRSSMVVGRQDSERLPARFLNSLKKLKHNSPVNRKGGKRHTHPEIKQKEAAAHCQRDTSSVGEWRCEGLQGSWVCLGDDGDNISSMLDSASRMEAEYSCNHRSVLFPMENRVHGEVEDQLRRRRGLIDETDMGKLNSFCRAADWLEVEREPVVPPRRDVASSGSPWVERERGGDNLVREERRKQVDGVREYKCEEVKIAGETGQQLLTDDQKKSHRKKRHTRMKIVRKLSLIFASFQKEHHDAGKVAFEEAPMRGMERHASMPIRRAWSPIINTFGKVLGQCVKRRSTSYVYDSSFPCATEKRDCVPIAMPDSLVEQMASLSVAMPCSVLDAPPEEGGGKANRMALKRLIERLTAAEEYGIDTLEQSVMLRLNPLMNVMPTPKVGLSDFRIIKLIGKGGFGEVYLVEHIRDKKLMALKVLDKRLTVAKKKQQLFNEYAILTKSCQTPFLLSLYYSFESEHYLYFAMKYCPGGDLRTLLRVVGALDEQDAQLYMAEIICSVDALHRLEYIHRDLKPDNFLIDDKGHLVLADFGLSKERPHSSCHDTTEVKRAPRHGWSSPTEKQQSSQACSILLGEQQLDVLNAYNLDLKFKRTRVAKTTLSDTPSVRPIEKYRNKALSDRHRGTDAICSTPPQQQQQGRVTTYSMVGSPDYMSPEVLSKRGYGYEIDWWSVGCLFFELLLGVPPFFADTVEGVFYNIDHWETRLPEILKQCDQLLSPESLDLITTLLCKSESRAKLRGIEVFKSHAYFEGISWDNLSAHTPPFVPILRDVEDTSYFDQSVTVKEQRMIPVDMMMGKLKTG